MESICGVEMPVVVLLARKSSLIWFSPLVTLFRKSCSRRGSACRMCTIAHLVLYPAFAFLQLAFWPYLPGNVVGGDQKMGHFARFQNPVEANLQETRFDAAIGTHACYLDAVEGIQAGHQFFLDVVAQQKLDVFLGGIEGLGRNHRLEQFKEIVARLDLEPQDPRE